MQDDAPIIGKLRPYLTKPLNKDGAVKLQALRFELAEARVSALELLLQKRRQMLWPKDKDFTELDRKTRLDGDVSIYEKNYQFLVQLEEITRDQIELYKVISSG